MSIEEDRTHLRDVNEELAALELLFKQEAFEQWQEDVEVQVNTRRDKYELVAPEGMDTLVQNEFIRGEIAGLRLALAMLVQKKEGLVAARDVLYASIAEQEDEGE